MSFPLPTDEVQRLESLRRYEILDTPPEEAFDRITRMVARVFEVPIAQISLVDADRQWFKSCYGVDTRETGRDVSFCAHAIMADKVLVVPNATQDERFAFNPLVTAEKGIRFYAGAPLRGRDGFKLGTLCICDTNPRTLSENELATLADLAAIVVDELELRMAGSQLREQAAASRRHQEALQAGEARTRLIIETAHDAFVGMDSAGLITDWNQRAEAIFGWSRDEAIGRTLAETIVPTRYRKAHENRLQKFLTTGEGPVLNRSIEIEAVRRDGSEFPVELSISPLRWGDRSLFTAFVRDITARKEAENELQREQVFLKVLLESTQEGIVACDENGTLTLFNGATREFHGIAAQALSADEWAPHYDLFLADGITPMQTADIPLFRALNGEIVHDVQMVIAPKHKAPRTVVANGRALFDAQGHKLGAVVTMHDITRNKQAAQSAWDSEKRFAAFMRHIPGVAFMKDVNGHYVYVNPTFEKLFDLSLEHVQGKTDDELWPTEFAAQFKANDTTVLSNRSVLQLIESVPGENETRHWLTTKFPILDDKGAVLLLGGVAVDITDRQRADDALRESEARLRMSLLAGHMGVWEIDLHAMTVQFSDTLETLLGVPVGTFGERHEDFMHSVHPDDREHLQRAMEELTTGGEDVRPEFRINRPDGSTIWAVSMGRLMRDEMGHPAHIIGLMVDITGRKQSEARLQAYAAKLERSNRELQDFSYVASHDLQEPLRKIRAFGDRLEAKHGSKLDEQGREYLGFMQDSAVRMQTLISDLLDFSRVTTRARPFTPIDLTETMRQVLSDLELRIEQSRGTVEMGALPIVEADATQMRQLWQNLIANALKFHRPGVPPRVWVEGRLREDRMCEVVVRDNGIGFEARFLERIFQPFQRLHTREEYEGTGIGLAICRKIVERHGGTITAQSTLGQGTEFMVTLPVEQVKESEMEEETL